MNNQPEYLTPEGLASIERKLLNLKEVRRPEVAERLRHIMQEGGELSESAEYEEAKKDQAFVENEIARLTRIVNTAIIIDETAIAKDSVKIGSYVTVMEKGGEPEVYHLVGTAEANPSAGKVSYESPFGRALMGAKVNDKVVVNAPDGDITFVVKKIE